MISNCYVKSWLALCFKFMEDQLCFKITDFILKVFTKVILKTNRQARRKRCGMAAVAAPKICRDKRKRREERKRKDEKEKRKEKKGKKGRGDQERKMYYAYMGVKHPFRIIKQLLKTRKEGGWKQLKKQEERKRRHKKKRPEKKLWHRQRTDWDVRI